MALAAIASTSSAPNTPTAAGPPAAASNSSRARSGVTFLGPPANIAPTYAAPSRIASRASSKRVSPQNLTLATRPPRDADQRRRRRATVLRRRERRSDEHRVRADCRRTLDVGAAVHPALVHRGAIAGHERHQARADRIVDRERLEVPVVDADHRVLDPQRVLQLAFVAHLEQHVEAECTRLVPQRAAALRRERTSDQGDRGRAGGTGLEELKPAHDEVLPEQRHARDGTGRPQVIERTAEPRGV